MSTKTIDLCKRIDAFQCSLENYVGSGATYSLQRTWRTSVANGGHIAFISGANRGIGAEVARQLASKGMAIVIGARRPDSAEEAKEAVEREGGEALIVEFDVTSSISISKAIEKVSHAYGELHVLINNAGADYDTDQNASTADIARIRSNLEVNLIGAWSVASTALPLMKATPGPRTIVNVSSGAGRLSNMGKGPPGYSVSKAGLNAFTRILAAELDHDSIRVNAVDPGWVATDMGGSGGRPVCDGAAGIVWAATLDSDGPTGQFFRDGRSTEW